MNMKNRSKPLVETTNLGKVYYRKKSSQIKALEGINLEVFPSEFVAIVGRSGSGKTTLLNLIGALDRPTTGEVKIEGKNLGNLSNRDLALLRREKIGFIFQTFNLLPSLTVFENVEAALVHSPMSKDQRSNKVATLLDLFELTTVSNHLPLELSVGQQQKVAIARAIVKDPVLILADEPTGEMDPMAGREIFEKLIELNRKSQVTLIVASHTAILHSEADQTLFINAGRLVSQIEAGY
jgi:putative ABC transport system ATP-binding protein